MSAQNKVVFQLLNIIGVVSTVLVNYLSNWLTLNGNTVGSVSDSIPNLFAPAGITFSIWGIIYSLLFAFTAYQGRDIFTPKKVEMPFLHKIGYFFFLSNLANIGWIFAWLYESYLLSLVLMLVIFITLLIIYLRLEIALPDSEVPKNERWLVQLPFSVYLGWITVATIANTTSVLVVARGPGTAQLLGIGDATWTVLVILIGALIGGLTVFRRKDVAYGLVVIWAYLGIVIKRSNPAFPPQPTIILATWVSIIAIGVVIGFIVWSIVKTPEKTESPS